MNSVNLESVSEATGNYLIYNAESDSNFDRIAVKMLLSNSPTFLAPVKIMNKFDNSVVKYELGNFRSIQSIKMRMSKKECSTLLYNLLNPMMSCGEWLLDYHKFCYQKDYILCDMNTFDVKFVYILDKDYYCSDSEIMDVFRSVFKNTDIIDDKDFRINLLQALLDEDFSINSLYEMIIKIIKKPTIVSTAVQKDAAPARTQTIKRPPELQQQEYVPQTADEHVKSEPVIVSDDDSDEYDMSNLFSNNKKSAKVQKAPKVKNKPKSDLFGNLFGKNKAPKENSGLFSSERETESDQTIIADLSNDPGSDETQIVSAFLHLESTDLKNSPENITLAISEGGTLTIGRKSANSSSANADVEFPSECTKISRRHCQIKLENGIYSICDLNSGNGTFVDGKKADPGVWIELQNGSQVMFGNNVAVYSMQINA